MKWGLVLEPTLMGGTLLCAYAGPLEWTFSPYYAGFKAGRLSLTWLTPWAWGTDFHLKSYLWVYEPDDDFFWGRCLGLEWLCLKNRVLPQK